MGRPLRPLPIALAVATALVAPFAQAGPFLVPHPGGLGFFGPTDPDVPAIWWNAAALGPLGGTHLHFSGAPMVLQQQITRDGSPTVENSDLQQDLFIGIASDLTTEHVRLGIAWHVPFREQGSFGHAAQTPDPTDDGPLRYHRLLTDWQNHYFSPAAAFRINDGLSFGLGMNLVWSDVRMAFDRDRPLDSGSMGVAAAGGLEQPAAAERLDISGTAFSVGVQAGFLWNILGRVTLGGAFISREGFGGRIRADRYGSGERNARITRADGTFVDGSGQIGFALPDVVNFGARWLVNDRLEAAASFRYVDWGQRPQSLELRLDSDALRAANQPQRIVLYRGLTDSYALWARGAYCARPPTAAGARCPLRLGIQVGFDTGHVDEQAVSADRLDGLTLDLALLFEWRVVRWLRLSGGAGLSVTAAQHVTHSVYDPDALVRCVDAGHEVGTCTAADAGQGLPSANGSYALSSYTGSLAIQIDFGGR
jgi:long-subunit fatty acid transport protein